VSQPIVKVFSATMAKNREALGEDVTDWLREHPEVIITEIRTLQSSDQAYHCLTFIVFGREGKEETEYVRPPPTSMPGEPEPRELPKATAKARKS
jgi:hypothetical protein